MWQPSLDIEDVQILKKEELYDGHHKIVNYHIKHQTFEGTTLGPIERECVERRPAVAVLLLDPVRSKVVLIEQFRPGALNAATSPWLLEVVAGLIDEGEVPEQTALRESLEEAGCSITQLIPICAYYPSPGGFNEKTHLYCGVVDSQTAPLLSGLSEEHEDIKVHVMSCEQAYQLRDSGVINNGTTLIALYWLEQHFINGVLRPKSAGQ